MAICCEERNNAAESKCENLLSLEALKQIFLMTKQCYYVRRNICFFFYNIYLHTERAENDE